MHIIDDVTFNRMGEVMRCVTVFLVATFLSLYFLTQTIPAATIHVPAGQPTIQAGINAALNGDTVLVEPGSYSENVSFSGKGIVVSGSGGAEITYLQPQSTSQPIVTIANGEPNTAELSGFTLRGARGQTAVLISGSSPLIQYNYFTDNQGEYQEQSIIKVQDYGFPTIRYNSFFDNPNAHAAIHTDFDDSITFVNNTIVVAVH